MLDCPELSFQINVHILRDTVTYFVLLKPPVYIMCKYLNAPSNVCDRNHSSLITSNRMNKIRRKQQRKLVDNYILLVRQPIFKIL